MAAVAFWGVEVKAGVPLRVKADKENVVKISQATFSEVKNKGNESIHLVLNVNDQKFVIGTLIPNKISQIFYDLFLDRDFELSHNGKNGSVYFYGYRPPSPDESDDDTDSDFGELPLISKENGEPEPTEEKPILTTEKAAVKSKVTIVEPKKGANTNEDDDEDSDEDFDEDDESESQEEKPNLTTEKAAAMSKVTIVESKKGDNTDEDSDEDSDEDFDEDSDKDSDEDSEEDSDEDDESESQEEKPILITEKSTARSMVTIVEPKKGTNEDDDEDSDEDSDDEDFDENSDDETKSHEAITNVSGDDSSDEEDGSSDEDDADSDEQDGSSEEEDEDTPKKGKKRPAGSSTKTPVPEKKAKFATPQKTDIKKAGEHISTPHPSKKAGKTPANNDKSKQQTLKSAGQVACKSCSKTFNSDGALQSHTRAKHSDGK